jgi:hypothetical protein
MMSENCPKIYIIEIKIVSLSSQARVTKRKGEIKNEADVL